MRKRAFIIFTLYLWGRVLYGLIFHPYRTLREINRHPILAPVLLTPFFSLIVLFFMGRIGAFLLDIHGVHRQLLAIILSSGLLSIAFWQVLLFYFLITLISAKRKEDYR
ncbi:MAG TPA: hypothetical protein VFQ63_02260 [Patescibacteria group bacterium]|nr:hypothetical protein [Patescibacteria group bacterium]